MPWAMADDVSLHSIVMERHPRQHTHIINDSHDDIALMLQAWIERSGQMPLYCLVIFDKTKSVKFHIDIMDLFIREAARWYIVDFSFATQSEVFCRLSTVDSYLPLLHSIFFEVGFLETRPSEVHISKAWNTPRLKEATIVAVSLLSRPALEIIPSLAQVEDLLYTPNSLHKFLDLVSTFQYLKYFHLDLVHEWDDVRALGDIQPSTITLPNVRHLGLFGLCSGVQQVLHRLVLPALQSLDLDFMESLDSSTAEQILRALGRLEDLSRCHIRRLSSPFTLFLPLNVPDLLAKIGPIRELRILFSTDDDNIRAIHNFAVSDMFKQVTTMHMVFLEHPEDEPMLFSKAVSIVESRMPPSQGGRGIGQLQALSFETVRPSLSSGHQRETRISINMQSVQRLLKLREDGLNLLGNVVDGKWCSLYSNRLQNLLEFRRAVRRWARFGHCDWLYTQEMGRYLENRDILEKYSEILC
ncbi:hypothetical protein VNI00_008639 [Paramarasmius palmivorus]|uniref:F-box domain-containing protein n=1 Tax=Paramarasmius palmivorus TaxID=297713 RepID=A0AAW0CWL6_9AGAR